MSGSLAALIARLGAGEPVWDRAFARRLATALSDHAERLRLPQVDAMGWQDVALTFHLAEQLAVVVTGRHPEVPGELTLRWRERDLAGVEVSLAGDDAREPYLVCSLDFSQAGQDAWLPEAAPPVPAGQRVRIRARATVGRREEWRVQALGRSLTVPELRFDPPS